MTDRAPDPARDPLAALRAAALRFLASFDNLREATLAGDVEAAGRADRERVESGAALAALAAPTTEDADAAWAVSPDAERLARAYLTVTNSLRFDMNTDAKAFWTAVATEYAAPPFDIEQYAIERGRRDQREGVEQGLAQLACDRGEHPAAEVHLTGFARLDKQPDPEDQWWCKRCGATWRAKDPVASRVVR